MLDLLSRLSACTLLCRPSVSGTPFNVVGICCRIWSPSPVRDADQFARRPFINYVSPECSRTVSHGVVAQTLGGLRRCPAMLKRWKVYGGISPVRPAICGKFCRQFCSLPPPACDSDAGTAMREYSKTLGRDFHVSVTDSTSDRDTQKEHACSKPAWRVLLKPVQTAPDGPDCTDRTGSAGRNTNRAQHRNITNLL